jgi:hypothetical protein
VGVEHGRDDLIATLKRDHARLQTDYQEACRRLQLYSDTLVVISELQHHEIQRAVILARQALKA